MSERAQNIVFAGVVGAALVVVIFGALVWSGRFVDNGTKSSTPRPAQKRASVPPPPPPPPQPVTTQAPKTAPVATTARVTIDASRGDCWVVAHTGSATGPLLLERVVRQGETVTLQARRVYLELGAAGNVDVQVNGRARTIPSGTTDLVLG
jgi:hypothetical protein